MNAKQKGQQQILIKKDETNIGLSLVTDLGSKIVMDMAWAEVVRNLKEELH